MFAIDEQKNLTFWYRIRNTSSYSMAMSSHMIGKVRSNLNRLISMFNSAPVGVKIAIGSTAGCISLVLLRIGYHRIRKKVKKLPPGPLGVPFFGVAFLFAFAGMEKFYTKILTAYGDIAMYSMVCNALIHHHIQIYILINIEYVIINTGQYTSCND